ncbi:PfkB family carbohydrate kinase [Roseibium litorale]|uniref:Bifunctional hydroxymethylpyrimidine kinase/phosphomethylpyrimidine kinase n=1 Tax=Roseibium litorale TaxID=2803841 RepID=A0ABR9CHT2_9HYPH|nr:PfkB family carbohydrate kinase [Roseibium litorale]MBD8890387.1 bifunctional hydroxymethylpyrimidine kinase/phosphomethylpyrimidine kinase [Roseibium litorale]
MTSTPTANTTPPERVFPLPVACFGAIHYDIIAHADRMILRDTSTPARIDMKPGGVATNVARSLARLGVPVTLTGMIGDDSAGASIQLVLKMEGVGTDLTVREGYTTGQYLALHDPDGGLAAACISDTVLSSAPLGLFEAAAQRTSRDGWWLLDANLSGDALALLADAAPSCHLAAEAVSIAKAPRLRFILPKLTLLFLNRAEAAALSGLPANTPPDLLSSALFAQGARNIIITDGARPLHLRTEDLCVFFPTPQANVVDVTGAGDALVAGTLAALGRGLPLEMAVKAGQEAARIALENPGAAPANLAWSAVASTLGASKS